MVQHKSRWAATANKRVAYQPTPGPSTIMAHVRGRDLLISQAPSASQAWTWRNVMPRGRRLVPHARLGGRKSRNSSSLSNGWHVENAAAAAGRGINRQRRHDAMNSDPSTTRSEVPAFRLCPKVRSYPRCGLSVTESDYKETNSYIQLSSGQGRAQSIGRTRSRVGA